MSFWGKIDSKCKYMGIKKQYDRLMKKLARKEKEKDKEQKRVERISQSKVFFEKVDDMEHLFVDDRLETKKELVIYKSDSEVEDQINKHINRYDEKDIEGFEEIVLFGKLDDAFNVTLNATVLC